jgi:hypothetical protein
VLLLLAMVDVGVGVIIAVGSEGVAVGVGVGAAETMVHARHAAASRHATRAVRMIARLLKGTEEKGRERRKTNWETSELPSRGMHSQWCTRGERLEGTSKVHGEG